ncbi:MAG: SPOR domain-containing protein [Maricaulaceae bacterium]
MAQDNLGAYAPPPDDWDDEDTFDARDDEDTRGTLVLIVALAVVVVIVAIAWSTYRLGVRERGRDEPPLIAAQPGPYKVRPDDPGGAQAPHQDKEVFAQLDGDAGAAQVRPAPPPERPIDRPPPVRVRTEAAPGAAEPAEQSPSRATQAEQGQNRPAGAPPQLRASRTQPADAAPTPNQRPEPTSTAEPAEPAPSEAASAEPPPPEPARPTGVDPNGGYVVQLASFRSQDDALAAWSSLEGRLGPVLAGMSADIAEADLGERGVWHRLRAAAFADRAAAGAACDLIKAQGQDCLVAAR